MCIHMAMNNVKCAIIVAMNNVDDRSAVERKVGMILELHFQATSFPASDKKLGGGLEQSPCQGLTISSHQKISAIVHTLALGQSPHSKTVSGSSTTGAHKSQ